MPGTLSWYPESASRKIFMVIPQNMAIIWVLMTSTYGKKMDSAGDFGIEELMHLTDPTTKTPIGS